MATAEKVAISREIAGVGRLDYEENGNRRAYKLLPEGGQRRTIFPSVTEILRACWPSGEGLLNWQGKIGNAEAKRVREESSAIGQDTHRFLDHWFQHDLLLTFESFPENRRPYLQGAARFLFEREPKPVATEVLVCHPELRYAGRFDFLGVLNDCDALTLLDYKTSRAGNLYAKAHAQLAGYALADGRCGGQPIERYGVVGINGEGKVEVVFSPIDQAATCWLNIVTYYASMQALLGALGVKE